MLLVGEWWRRCLKIALLLLITATEMSFVDARPGRSLLRRHGTPRPAAAVDARLGSSSTTRGRWLTPCAGGSTVDTPPLHSSATASTDESSLGDVEDVTSQHGRRKLLRRLSRQMSRLADRVDRLKLRYVSRCISYSPITIKWQHHIMVVVLHIIYRRLLCVVITG